MTNYFENCKTSEELKATYKELVKKFHPDIYGEKGNDILKDIHNQLEKATRNIDKKYYSEFNNTDRKESDEIRAAKEEIARNVYKQHAGLAYQYLFVAYWQAGLKPSNHRNPATQHNFSGWNVWQLELEMLLNGYNSCEWSTFAQIRDNKNSVKKGEHGTKITLAIIKKSKNEDENENEEQKTTGVYYKGYTVFNMEQTNDGAKATEPEEQPAQITEVKAIETKLNLEPEKIQAAKNSHDEVIEIFKTLGQEQTEQKTLNLWDTAAVVA